MNNKSNSVGALICETVLIDNYPLALRYYKIRARVNSKLEELASGGVYAKVEVDECDRLKMNFYKDKIRSDIIVPIEEGLVDNGKDGAQSQQENFIEEINKAIHCININQTKKMKQNSKPQNASPTDEVWESIANDVTKLVTLYQGENGSILKKTGFDISEACHNLTAGVIDSLVIDEGIISFINYRGLNMTFNTIGHSETEIANVIAEYIRTMMALTRMVMPLDGTVNTSKPKEEQPKESISTETTPRPELCKTKKSASHSKVKKITQARKCMPTTTQSTEFNKLIKVALDTIDWDDKISKRAFSQQLRGKMLQCANKVGLNTEDGSSIECFVKLMNFENIRNVKTVYELYKQKEPDWLVRLCDNADIQQAATLSNID